MIQKVDKTQKNYTDQETVLFFGVITFYNIELEIKITFKPQSPPIIHSKVLFGGGVPKSIILEVRAHAVVKMQVYTKILFN